MKQESERSALDHALYEAWKAGFDTGSRGGWDHSEAGSDMVTDVAAIRRKYDEATQASAARFEAVVGAARAALGEPIIMAGRPGDNTDEKRRLAPLLRDLRHALAQLEAK